MKELSLNILDIANKNKQGLPLEALFCKKMFSIN